MAIDIGELISNVALGGTSFLKGRRERNDRRSELAKAAEVEARERTEAAQAAAQDQEDRYNKRQRDIEDAADRERERVRKALAADALVISNRDARAKRALDLQARFKEPDPDPGETRVTWAGFSRSFSNTPSGRDESEEWMRQKRIDYPDGNRVSTRTDDDATGTFRPGGESDVGMAVRALAQNERDPQRGLKTKSFTLLDIPGGPRLPFRADPSEETTEIIGDITARNDVRREVNADPNFLGATRDQVEAEVDRRIAEGRGFLPPGTGRRVPPGSVPR